MYVYELRICTDSVYYKHVNARGGRVQAPYTERRVLNTPTFKMASDMEQPSLLGENGGEEISQGEQVSIEKRNLINLTKLSVKGLIEAAMKRAQALNDSNPQLRQLLLALEHCLRHKLKGRV